MLGGESMKNVGFHQLVSPKTMFFYALILQKFYTIIVLCTTFVVVSNVVRFYYRSRVLC